MPCPPRPYASDEAAPPARGVSVRTALLPQLQVGVEQPQLRQLRLVLQDVVVDLVLLQRQQQQEDTGQRYLAYLKQVTRLDQDLQFEARVLTARGLVQVAEGRPVKDRPGLDDLAELRSPAAFQLQRGQGEGQGEGDALLHLDVKLWPAGNETNETGPRT